MRKQWLCLLFVALVGAGQTVQAQDSDKRDERRQEMVEKRAKQLARQFKLDDAATEWFVPLYVEYSDTLRAVRARLPRSRELDKLSDADAATAAESLFTAEERAAALKRSYYVRFKEKLTPQQALRLFVPQAPARRSNANRGAFGGPQGGPGGFPGGGPGMGGGF